MSIYRRALRPQPLGRPCSGSPWEGCLSPRAVRWRRGVYNAQTFRFGLGRTSAGLARIPHVFAGSECFHGLEDSSSHTSGTVFPQVSGFLAAECVQRLTR
jgi:hypothetical protein